jgi:hypothetical protein
MASAAQGLHTDNVSTHRQRGLWNHAASGIFARPYGEPSVLKLRPAMGWHEVFNGRMAADVCGKNLLNDPIVTFSVERRSVTLDTCMRLSNKRYEICRRVGSRHLVVGDGVILGLAHLTLGLDGQPSVGSFLTHEVGLKQSVIGSRVVIDRAFSDTVST